MSTSFHYSLAANRFRWLCAAAAVQLALRRLPERLAKAGFRPDQPRVPAGNPDGGQWTDELVAVSDPDQPPDVPEHEPPTVPERNRVAVAVARYLIRHLQDTPTVLISRGMFWVMNHARDRIIAYLEPPRSLEDLQSRAELRLPGYDVHHIVEQTPARRDNFPEPLVQGRDNLVLIPTYRHWEINGWYARPNEEFGDVSPREYLRGTSWKERRRVGLYALRLFGVLE